MHVGYSTRKVRPPKRRGSMRGRRDTGLVDIRFRRLVPCVSAPMQENSVEPTACEASFIPVTTQNRAPAALTTVLPPSAVVIVSVCVVRPSHWEL